MSKIIRLGALAAGMLVSLALTAVPALAQNYPPRPTEETKVPQGTEVAFTGSDVMPLVLVAAVLLIVGVAALILARRRAAAAG